MNSERHRRARLPAAPAHDACSPTRRAIATSRSPRRPWRARPDDDTAALEVAASERPRVRGGIGGVEDEVPTRPKSASPSRRGRRATSPSPATRTGPGVLSHGIPVLGRRPPPALDRGAAAVPRHRGRIRGARAVAAVAQRRQRGTEAPDTEAAVPLESIAEPQTEVTQPQLGRRVTRRRRASSPRDFIVLTGRNNGDAADGAWLVGAPRDRRRRHASRSRSAGLRMRPPRPRRGESRRSTGPLVGRYLPSEAPTDSDFEAGERSALSVAELINIWPDAEPAYGGYLVLDDAWPRPRADLLAGPLARDRAQPAQRVLRRSNGRSSRASRSTSGTAWCAMWWSGRRRGARP